MINPNYYPWGYDSDNGERGPLLPAPTPGETGPASRGSMAGDAGSGRARGSAAGGAEAARLSLAGAEEAKLVEGEVNGEGSLS